ncbi:MAG: LacI family transcriptional regulator [Spirochaetales bacterium]|jgi:LacI family transcriptional regulator|nr:LacI family transcriptional regulator [Spirochaetales bacterium]
MVTILEVARKAKVSITTVSRVLNNSSHKVNKRTREQVLKTVKELDYRPNALAKSLLKKCSMTIGVIIPDISNPYYAEIVRGIQDAADRAGYSVLIQNSDLKAERIIQSVYELREKHADGVIFAGGVFHENNLISAMKNLSSRAVVIGRFEGDLPAVRIDNEYAAFIAVQHLVELGHSKIAFVNGATDSSTMADRLQGFMNALVHFNCPLRKEFVVMGALTLSGGYAQVKSLLKKKQRPSAIIMANDQMAFGAVKAIKEAKLLIPEDVAVVGFDNVPLCSYFEPSITSIEIPRYNLGQAAMELLIELIAGNAPKEKIRWFRVDIIKRQSTVPGFGIREKISLLENDIVSGREILKTVTIPKPVH